jgi:hypothetical protein
MTGAAKDGRTCDFTIFARSWNLTRLCASQSTAPPKNGSWSLENDERQVQVHSELQQKSKDVIGIKKLVRPRITSAFNLIDKGKKDWQI